jgi:cell shape-determining protein MreC
MEDIQMVLIRGKPIVLVCTAIILSVVIFVMLLSSWDWIYFFVLFSNFYSTVTAIVFYLAYKRSEYSFMSPQKYKKYEMVYIKNQKLYELLTKIDKNNVGLKPDNAIDKAIEMLSKL